MNDPLARSDGMPVEQLLHRFGLGMSTGIEKLEIATLEAEVNA